MTFCPPAGATFAFFWLPAHGLKIWFIISVYYLKFRFYGYTELKASFFSIFHALLFDSLKCRCNVEEAEEP